MPTPIPFPPTDNLYKFVAISGLVFLLTSVVLYVTVRLEVRQHWTSGMTVLQARADMADILLKKAIGPPSNLTPSESEEWKEAIANQFSELKARLAQLEKTGIEVDEYWTSIYKADFLAPFLLAGLVVGVLLVSIGFYLWHSRLQKYQDIILARKAGSVRDRVE